MIWIRQTLDNDNNVMDGTFTSPCQEMSSFIEIGDIFSSTQPNLHHVSQSEIFNSIAKNASFMIHLSHQFIL